MPWPSDIVLIGAGNVAWHLGQQLKRCGQNVCHVYSRTAANAMELATALECPGSAEIEQIPTEADLYLLLVPDSAIPSVVARLKAQQIADKAMVMHTSGATPADVLAPHFKHYGVFYPLQTFSRGRVVDFAAVPLCLLTALPSDYPKVEQLAQRLVNTSYAVSDEQRAYLHLSAVFVNNFTNYLQYISQTLAQEQGLPIALLQPLLRETIDKLDQLSPPQAQTGPAIRKDEATITRHLELLKDHPEWAGLYRKLSDGISRELS